MATTDNELDDKIAHAKERHQPALKKMESWEQLFKGTWGQPEGVADKDIQSYVSSKPRSIVTELLAKLAVRAKTEDRVLPLKDTQAEDATCSKLTQFLAGYRWRMLSEKKQPIFRHAVQWGLIRGKAVLVAQYVPRFVNTEFFPVRTDAPDPATIFEVPGENGIMYFVRESQRYVLELKREIAKRAKFDAAGRWQIPGRVSERRETDRVKVTEYFDGEYYAVKIEDELVLPPTEHGYGFCPISVQYMEDWPFKEMEWKGQASFASTMDALKNMSILLAKMGDAVSTLFWPDILVESPDGRSFVLNSKNAASVQAVPPGSKVQIITVSPNMPVLEQYASMLQSDISVATLPDMAFGQSIPASGASGYAVAQILSQMMDRINDKKENLEFLYSDHFEQVLRLVATFSERAEGGKFELLTQSPAGHGKNVQKSLAINADDIGEHFRVESRITPALPTEKMAIIQQMAALRAPSPVTGLPILDDDTLREMNPEIFENAAEAKERVEELYWRKKVPQIEQWEQEEYMETWVKDHPPHVPRGTDLQQLSKPELVQRLQMLQMMLSNPQALAQMLGQGKQPPGQPPGAPPGGPQGMPAGAPQGMPQPGSPPFGGAPPQMLPPQMASGNPDPLQGQTPEGLGAAQMGRGTMPPR